MKTSLHGGRGGGSRAPGRTASLGRAILALLLALGLVPALALGAAAQQATPTPTAQADQTVVAPQLVTINMITETPAAYVGRTVALTGEIENVVGPRSFVTEDDDPIFNEQLLVVATVPLPGFQLAPAADADADVGVGVDAGLDAGVGIQDLQSVLDDDKFIAVGDIRRFNLVEFERELGVDLDDDAFRGFDGRTAMIARQLSIQAPRIQEITEFPAVFAGRAVTVSGNVGEIVGLRAFTIEGDDGLLDGDGLLVVSAKELSTFTPAIGLTDVGGLTDVNAVVHGPVRLFNLVEFERELGVDLDDAAFGAFDGRPAIVAQAVNFVPARGGFLDATP